MEATLSSSKCKILQINDRIEVFWPYKFLSMNDEMIEMSIEQCHVIMDQVNNLSNKQILVENFWAKNIDDVENMGYIIEDLHNEELHGEMNYISKDGLEGFIGESRFNSMNKGRSEKNIVKGDEEVGGEENFQWNKEDYNQGNARGNDDIVYGHGVKGTNSNTTRRCQYEWWRIECDLIDNNGVFIAKGWVVACNPQEVVLDDRLGKDHVGLCILYCPMTMSTVMTIWKWLLA